VVNWLMHMQTLRYAKPNAIDLAALERQYRELSWPAAIHPTESPT